LNWGRLLQLIFTGDVDPPEGYVEPKPTNPCQEVDLPPSYLRARRVTIPVFEISSTPNIPLSMIRERRFDLIERSQSLVRAEIQAADDQLLFDMVERVTGETAPEAPDAEPTVPDGSTLFTPAYPIRRDLQLQYWSVNIPWSTMRIDDSVLEPK